MSITKGYWKVQPYTLYASQMAPAEYPIHAPKRGLIGKAYKLDDAVCMAAAPELLALLQETLTPGAYGIGSTLALRIEAAIAKATGADK